MTETSTKVAEKITLNLVKVPPMPELIQVHKKLYHICDGAEAMLKKVTVHPVRINGIEITSADLVRISLEDLGFPDGAPLGKAYKEGRNRGLRVCPEFFGPLIREACPVRKAEHEMDYVAMNPIPHEGYLSIFMLEKDMHPEGNGKSLSSSFSNLLQDIQKHGEFKLAGRDRLIFWRLPENN